MARPTHLTAKNTVYNVVTGSNLFDQPRKVYATHMIERI